MNRTPPKTPATQELPGGNRQQAPDARVDDHGADGEGGNEKEAAARPQRYAEKKPKPEA